MLLLLISISLLIIIISAILIGVHRHDYSYGYDGVWCWLFGVGIIALMCELIPTLCCFDCFVELKLIDEKINMYEEENTKIENNIDTLVKQYISYEKNTFEEFKSESSIVLVNLYPELKSDELVKNQMKIYFDNNNKIKELKGEKISYQKAKWWLYFGEVGGDE